MQGAGTRGMKRALWALYLRIRRSVTRVGIPLFKDRVAPHDHVALRADAGT